jgi:hypothetical protein
VWIVEINVLGRRFTHHLNARPATPRLVPTLTNWRTRKQRAPRAAV